MKTAEEIHKFCYTWLSKAFEAGLKQSPTDAENSEFYLPMLDLSWAKQMKEKIESYADSIRSEEQAKTRETAIEFACVSMIGTGKLEDSDIPTLHDEVSDFYDSGDWEFTNKAQHCSECGKPMEKKEIIIKGDEDTCDECLCPE